MLTIQDVNRAIMLQEWTNTELSSMIDAVKWARSQLTRDIKNTLKIGDNVNFTSSKTGCNMTGHVVKVAIKYVTVRTIDGMWKVPANMLTVVKEKELA
jgi:uncharacterized membrane protein